MSGFANIALPIEGKLLAASMCAVITALLVVQIANGSMMDWVMRSGVSWQALSEGRLDTIVLHMVAHAGLIHLFLNATSLWILVPLVISHLGKFPANIGRFFIVFFLSGLSGMGAFLLLHLDHQTPMVGASGAIFGLLGLLWRISPADGRILPLRSRRTWVLMKEAAINQLPLLLLFTLPAVLNHTGGGLAWEAHLGGLLFGLIAAPHIVRLVAPSRIEA